MRSMHYLNARHRLGAGQPDRAAFPSGQGADASGDWVGAAMDALDDIGELVSTQCFSHPDALTPDGITAYALALMRLRECASAAGLERLTNACDALAVTVARLIEDRSCACHDKCETLTRFVTHAHAMIQMAAGACHLRPTPLRHNAAAA